MSCSEWTLEGGSMRHQSLASVSVEVAEVAGGGNYDRGKLALYRSWRRVDISTFSRVPPELTNTLVIPDHGAQPSIATMVNRWTGAWLGWAGLGWCVGGVTQPVAGGHMALAHCWPHLVTPHRRRSAHHCNKQSRPRCETDHFSKIGIFYGL